MVNRGGSLGPGVLAVKKNTLNCCPCAESMAQVQRRRGRGATQSRFLIHDSRFPIHPPFIRNEYIIESAMGFQSFILFSMALKEKINRVLSRSVKNI